MVKVLVVEDSKLLSNIIQASLKNLGHEVSAAVSTGEDAIKKAGFKKPDLVLMDIVLEGKMDGINAASEVRSRYNIPVIYLTGQEEKTFLERAKITEPFSYLIKPFRENELNAAIEIAIYKSKMEKDLKKNFEEWQKHTVGREVKMSELKNEIKELKERLSEYE
jgi:DNA-binding NtrC family response regulator